MCSSRHTWPNIQYIIINELDYYLIYLQIYRYYKLKKS